jgi:hypothetical protein
LYTFGKREFLFLACGFAIFFDMTTGGKFSDPHEHRDRLLDPLTMQLVQEQSFGKYLLVNQ